MSDRPIEDALRVVKEKDAAAQQERKEQQAAIRAEVQRNIDDFIRLMREAGIEPVNIGAPVYENVPVGRFGSQTVRRLAANQPPPVRAWCVEWTTSGNWDRPAYSYITEDGRRTGHSALHSDDTMFSIHNYGVYGRPEELARAALRIIEAGHALG